MTHPRSTWRVFALAVPLFALAVGVGFADEQEEANPKKPVKKIVVLEDDTPTGGANVLQDVARAANAATHPVLKKYLSDLSVACDRVGLDNRTLRVLPLPLVWGKDKYPADGFGVAALDASNKTGEVQAISPKDVRSVTHFEQLVLQETDRLLKVDDASAPPKAAKLAAIELALSAALAFHEAAADGGRRRGANWEPFKSGIADRLTDARLTMVQSAVEGKQWDVVRALVGRFSERYTTSPKILQVLMAARLHEGVLLAKSDKFADLEKARDLVSEFDSRFPNTGNEQSKQIRAALSEKAKQLLAEADRIRANNPVEARRILGSAEALNPDQEGLRTAQRELRAGYNTLVVGVKRMPRLMSPATAREDSELMAVELLFEGILEPAPDPDPAFGITFRPALAALKPKVGALAREVTLVGNADWGRPNTGSCDPADVVQTIKLLQEKRTLPSAEAADFLADPALDPTDPNRVRVRFKQGYPDLRELLTFKVLPGKYLSGKSKGIDDDTAGDSFARAPFGTGPFKLDPEFKPAAGMEPVGGITFVSNPNYWRRPGKLGQPAIKEVRFVNTAVRAEKEEEDLTELANMLKGDRLHLMTDVPTRHLDRYVALGKVAVTTAATNRRIHMLAINHASPAVQNVDLRRGLLHAIDREAILNDVYRAGKKEFHKALTGPYPVGCWQQPQPLTGAPAPLFDIDLARAKFRPLTDSARTLNLLYPSDDPDAEKACKMMKAQIEAAAGKAVEIVLEGVTAPNLRTRVEKETRYDLAYLPYDYPGPLFSHALAGMLDPSVAGRGGRNFLNYLVKSTNPTKADEAVGQMLAEVKVHSDWEGQLKPLSQELAVRFNEAVPFVPLWQLDRHIVSSVNLKMFFDAEATPSNPKLIDPVKVFHNAGRWRMDDSR